MTRARRTQAKHRTLAEVVVSINEQLPRCSGGLTKQELVDRIGNTSKPTVQRAFDELRDRWGAALTVSRNRWHLAERVPLPLLAPEDNDVLAVLIAAAIVDPLADEDLRTRLRTLAEQLDDRRRELRAVATFPARGISASLTLGSRIDEHVLRTLLNAVRGGVVRLRYASPWTNATVEHTTEPWELRIHDGAVYVRAWCRESGSARTFRLAHIAGDLEVVSNDGPRAAVCPPERTWAAGNPAYGIDEDRPDTAVLRIRGAVARWVFPVLWSPAQHDEWIEPGELLERTVPYHSCREMARRVLSIIDAVESIEPLALREEVDRSLDAWRAASRRKRGSKGRRR